MSPIAKIALSTLVLIASSANAAPLLTGLGGSSTGNAAVAVGVKTDLKVFADACVKVTTGGKTNTCDGVNLGLVTGLAANVRATLFSKLAVTQCLSSYSDLTACTEFGAYLAVSYYAYISGWAGATLFSALEPARVDRWHSLLDGFCAAPGAPGGVCGDWVNQWNTFDQVSASVTAEIKAAAASLPVWPSLLDITDHLQKLDLKSSGLLTLCDTTAILKAGADGIIRIGASATADAKAVVAATVNTGVDAKANVDATVDAVADASAKAAADVKAKADVAAAAAVGVSVDAKAKVDATITAALDASAKAAADIKAAADAAAAAALIITANTKANVDVTAAVDLDTTAKATAAAAVDAKAKADVAVAAVVGVSADVKANIDALAATALAACTKAAADAKVALAAALALKAKVDIKAALDINANSKTIVY